MASSSAADDSKPLVCLLTLDKPDFFNDLYKDFVRLLQSKARVQQIKTPEDARAAYTSRPPPAAILSADESLTASTRISLLDEALSYVRAGGILLFMGLFSSFTRPSDINTLFARLGLPWSSGDYHRTTFKINLDMKHFDTDGLARSYSQKALHLANVAHADAIYLPSDGSHVESMVFGPAPIDDKKQTPAALAKVGDGKIGYIGDVNNENETMPLVLAMCGI